MGVFLSVRCVSINPLILIHLDIPNSPQCFEFRPQSECRRRCQPQARADHETCLWSGEQAASLDLELLTAKTIDLHLRHLLFMKKVKHLHQSI